MRRHPRLITGAFYQAVNPKLKSLLPPANVPPVLKKYPRTPWAREVKGLLEQVGHAVLIFTLQIPVLF
jgi:hypothetical protein